jgi:acyl-coenzyme A synthetase/AMP-(fatty) acid ligase
MYSSGTTGAPKCMVHSVGGTLLKHLEEHVVQGNRDNTDVLLYYTTTGQIQPDYTELYISCVISLQTEVCTSRWLKASSKIHSPFRLFFYH